MITVKTFVFNFFSENTYILFDETKDAAIIDCGCINTKEENLLSDFIKSNNLVPKRLLTTHYHFDHIIGNTFVYKKYGLRPELHKDELSDVTPSLNKQAEVFGIATNFEETLPEHYLENYDEISFGNTVLKALPVGGHSPSSLAYYSEADKMVFVGDAIFCCSIGRTDLWGGNYTQLINNIRKSIYTLSDDTTIYSGHGETTTVGYEKANNPYIR